ncbi:MAG TPA: hypothetical protein VLE53_12640 [Gemmatimonadaceae bacterium]|nr:hypothetical protein [Gemmatimonadaceae bacterium]
MTDAERQGAPDGAPPAGGGIAARVGPSIFRMGALVLWWYLGIVFLYGEALGPVRFGAAVTLATLLVGTIVIARAVSARRRRGDVAPKMLDTGLLMLAAVGAVLAADVIFTALENARRRRAEGAISQQVRREDARLWHGEIFPRSYYPTDRDFTLFKPNVRVEGFTFGEYYTPAMLASPTLVDSVLERRPVSYAIGPHGVRELEPLGASRIFALGDSFVLGYATAEGRIWTDLLGTALGEPVYNLGVSSTGPRPQVELLRHFLSAHADSARPAHLLWMLFEGNDLENSYLERRPADAETAPTRSLVEGTILQPLASLPGRLKAQSVLRRLVRGELRVAAPAATRLGGRLEIDGVRLTTPLYHSARWGYRLFSPPDVERATKPKEYVLNHPHRPLLDRTFEEMRELSKRHGFRVTVLMAPSDARLYGPSFEGFPRLSEAPHFTEYVMELARRQGFDAVDLLPLMRPYAEREMLYYRDDHHWNARGNEVAALVIRQAVAPSLATP